MKFVLVGKTLDLWLIMTDTGNLKAFELNSEAHKFDDVDKSREAHHHTIGDGENQSASGAELKAVNERVTTLEDSKLETQAWTDIASVATNLTGTSIVDIGGLSITVPVGATTDVFLVLMALTALNNNTDGVSLNGILDVDGVDQDGQILMTESTANTARFTAEMHWIVTGLDAGDTIFKAQGSLSGAGSWTLNTGQCKLSVVKING